MRRQDIIAEAQSWLGTPYRHQGSLKGVGCDCLGLVRGVWRAVIGGEPEALPAYSPDWAEAGGGERMAAAAARHFQSIAIDRAGASDLVLFRWRADLPAKHAGILIDRGHFIHAHEGACVAEAPLGPWWQRHLAGAYRWPGIDV